MKKGGVRLRLEGLGAEKLVNALWAKGMYIRQLRRSKKRGVELETDEKNQRNVEQLAQEKGFQVTVLKDGWQGKLKKALRRRWGLAVGMIVGAALCICSLQYVWNVDVQQAGKYAGEVRLFLAENGIRPGILQSRVDTARLQEALLWRLPKVKWAWVKKEGVTLVVRLEEGVAAEEETTAPGPVVAGEDGVLQRVTVFAGTPVCKAGDSVKQGQVIILGEETGPDGEKIPVRAKGEAVALVQVQKTVRLPAREMITTPTGRTESRWIFATPFGSYTFETEPDYLLADRVYESCPLPGVWLPVTLKKETFLEVSGEWAERDAQELMQEGQKAAEEALIRTWPAAQNIDKSVKFSMIERGTIEVTAFAVLPMDIAQNGLAP